ncbi:hypothetical protein [Tropicimonas isoalkanivorans]|uniref:Uncharacterized protein n=1 Tax=Tropicimonas isoalkanivorans TaxID=441112 RepID=A0A1I1PBH5_9RHOB|nr:hypothetical protein [Tropicimonas isoalkanivorans]SFD07197.1 hypothetical protein SAMN04488094_114109 [Tropicimonas isoalkanivorans]
MFPHDEISELHAALTRAKAMGFEKTAEAMMTVLTDMLATNGESDTTQPLLPAGDLENGV